MGDRYSSSSNNRIKELIFIFFPFKTLFYLHPLLSYLPLKNGLKSHTFLSISVMKKRKRENGKTKIKSYAKEMSVEYSLRFSESFSIFYSDIVVDNCRKCKWTIGPQVIYYISENHKAISFHVFIWIYISYIHNFEVICMKIKWFTEKNDSEKKMPKTFLFSCSLSPSLFKSIHLK